MSTASKIAFEGLSAARSRLQVLVNGLRDAAGGGVVERAAEKVGDQVRAVSKRVLGDHVYTGNAQSAALVALAGGRIDLSSPGYLRFHGWWPFRGGMPPFVVTRAIKIFTAELEAALAGERSPLALADEAAEEKAEAARQKEAAKRKAQEDREAAAAEKSRAARAARAAQQARHESRIAKIRERSAKRSARHEARMQRARAKGEKREAREQARLGRVREKYKRDNARIWRRSAEGKAARRAKR